MIVDVVCGWLCSKFCFFFFKQKTAYEITEGDWSSDVCSSDLGLSPRFRRNVAPLTEFARAMPIAALVPVGLILLGPGTAMEASLIGFAAFFPILLSTTDGVRGVDPVTLEMAR